MDKYRVYILAAAFLWGTTGIYFQELHARGAEPVQIILIRTSFAMLGLGIWLLCTDRCALRIKLKDIWCFIGTGIVSLLFFNWCYIMAIEEIGMAVSGILLYTAPAIVAVLSVILFKEKLLLPGWGILAVILFGCALVSGVAGSRSLINMTGILFGLGSGFGYALYTIFSRYALMKGYSPQTISFYTFLFCSFGCIPFVVLTTDFFAGSSTTPGFITLFSDSTVWLYALALGFLSCFFPYWLYTKGLSGVTGATASMTATLEPVVAALFGVFLYNEILTLWQVTGMMLVLGGIIFLGKVNSSLKVP